MFVSVPALGVIHQVQVTTATPDALSDSMLLTGTLSLGGSPGNMAVVHLK